MLKTTKLSKKLAPKAFKADDDKIASDNSNKTNETVVNLSKNNKSKNLMYMPNIGVTRKLIFLISNTKKIFNHLKQAFIKALLFQHFD